MMNEIMMPHLHFIEDRVRFSSTQLLNTANITV